MKKVKLFRLQEAYLIKRSKHWKLVEASILAEK